MKMFFALILLLTTGCKITDWSSNNNTKIYELVENEGLMNDFSKTSKNKYAGHYFNGEIYFQLKKMDLNNQALFLLRCLDTEGAMDFDGEVSYEFKELFSVPYGFDKVRATAFNLLTSNQAKISKDSSGKIEKWLRR